MPQRVVDHLELVEVEAKHGKAAPATAGELPVHALGERNAVRQAGHGVMGCEIADVALGLDRGGDVLMAGDVTTLAEGLVGDLDGPPIDEANARAGMLPRLFAMSTTSK